MSLGCGDNYIRCHASGGGIVWVFFSSGKQHDDLKKNLMDKTQAGKYIDSEGINQYDVTDLWWQRSPHRRWWHIQETQVVYSVRRLVLRRMGPKTVVVTDMGLLSGFSLACLICEQTFCKRNNHDYHQASQKAWLSKGLIIKPRSLSDYQMIW